MSELAQCAETLRKLVAHNTTNPGGDEGVLAKHLAARLESAGADEVSLVDVEHEEGVGSYVYARFGTPSLVLNSHLDTVPVNSGWTRDPFRAEEVDDRVYGLGTCDIKGAAAAILTVLDKKPPSNVGILFSGDEERGSRVMPKFLASKHAEGIEKALVFEPTARKVGVRHRGIYGYRFSFLGKGGHSSRADNMDAPIGLLCELGTRLSQRARAALSEDVAMPGLCLNLAGLTGGIAYNVVPDSAELEMSIRPGPDFQPESFEAELDAMTKGVHPELRWQCFLAQPPFACGDEAGFAALLSEAHFAPASLDFWTEAALFQAAGIHSVVVGPGDIAMAHAADEYVSKADLSWAMHLIEGALGKHGS